MQKVHIICWKYDPSKAIFQRDWALVKGIAECGIEVECDFIMPNKIYCEKEPFNVRCNYWGDENANKGKILAYIFSIIRAISIVRKHKTILSCTLISIWLPLLIAKRNNLYIEKNECPALNVKNISDKIRLKFFHWMSKRSAGIFVISNNLREYFLNIGVIRDKVHVINMTVDDSRFRNIEKQECERYICYCGTVSNFKDGVNILLEAFGIISKEFPNMKLYILGHRPFAKDNKLNDDIIEKYGIKEQVYMPGAIPGNEMPQFLKNAELLVLARPDNIQAAYGFPTKLGEYLMSGNPVVVTKVGELSDFLEHGKSCLFAEPSNAIDFAEKLKWALLHQTDAKKIGSNGKKVAELSFNYKIESKKIADTIIRDSKK